MEKVHTTEEIVSALERRDPDALVWVEKVCGALMKRIARNLHLGKRDTEECMNDTFLEVWNTIPPEKPASIRSYTCMLMRRTVIDRIRYNCAHKRRDTAYVEIMDEIGDVCDTADTVIDGLCISGALNDFLRDQTVQNREIFIRRFYEFESTRSIAADLFMNVNTVDKRLSRMRRELKERLKDWGYNNE